jgi:hypothetical protein
MGYDVSKQSPPPSSSSSSSTPAAVETTEESIYETLAKIFFADANDDIDIDDDLDRTNKAYSYSSYYTNTVSLLRVGLPSLFLAASAKISYAPIAIQLANVIHDSGVFAVVAQDASQYIQNILTTSGLMFSILVGQTYYFMYQVSEVI